MNSGSQGANPDGLTLNEYDGYVVIEYDDGQIHLPWHVLPRKAARTLPTRTQLNFKNGIDVIGLNNTGVGQSQTDTFSLIAVSPDEPRGAEGQQMPMPDIRAVGVNTFPVPANFCSPNPSFVWAFAVNTWERQTHLLPVSHQVWQFT